MAFARRDTAQTMVSQCHSTSELGRGLDYMLNDLEKNLPETLEELQDLYIEVVQHCCTCV